MIVQTQRKQLKGLCRKVAGDMQLACEADIYYRGGRRLHLHGVSKGRKRYSESQYGKPWIAVFGFEDYTEAVSPTELQACRYAALLRQATPKEREDIGHPQRESLPALEMLQVTKACRCQITLVPTGVSKAYVPLI
jgi:hypothetical protein